MPTAKTTKKAEKEKNKTLEVERNSEDSDCLPRLSLTDDMSSDQTQATEKPTKGSKIKAKRNIVLSKQTSHKTKLSRKKKTASGSLVDISSDSDHVSSDEL